MPREREAARDPLLVWASDVQLASARHEYDKLRELFEQPIEHAPTAPASRVAASHASPPPPVSSVSAAAVAAANAAAANEKELALTEHETIWRAEVEQPLREAVRDLTDKLRQARSAHAAASTRAQRLAMFNMRLAEQVHTQRALRRSWGWWHSSQFEKRRWARVEEVCSFAQEQAKYALRDAQRAERLAQAARRAQQGTGGASPGVEDAGVERDEPGHSPEHDEALAQARAALRATVADRGSQGQRPTVSPAGAGERDEPYGASARRAARLEHQLVQLEEERLESQIAYDRRVAALEAEVAELRIEAEAQRAEKEQLLAMLAALDGTGRGRPGAR